MMIILGCRPHITSFCDLWVIKVKSCNFTHKAETAVWAAPEGLDEENQLINCLFRHHSMREAITVML